MGCGITGKGQLRAVPDCDCNLILLWNFPIVILTVILWHFHVMNLVIMYSGDLVIMYSNSVFLTYFILWFCQYVDLHMFIWLFVYCIPLCIFVSFLFYILHSWHLYMYIARASVMNKTKLCINSPPFFCLKVKYCIFGASNPI